MKAIILLVILIACIGCSPKPRLNSVDIRKHYSRQTMRYIRENAKVANGFGYRIK